MAAYWSDAVPFEYPTRSVKRMARKPEGAVVVLPAGVEGVAARHPDGERGRRQGADGDGEHRTVAERCHENVVNARNGFLPFDARTVDRGPRERREQPRQEIELGELQLGGPTGLFLHSHLTREPVCVGYRQLRVCGMGPSVAATTRMAPSICAAPVIMFLM